MSVPQDSGGVDPRTVDLALSDSEACFQPKIRPFEKQSRGDQLATLLEEHPESEVVRAMFRNYVAALEQAVCDSVLSYEVIRSATSLDRLSDLVGGRSVVLSKSKSGVKTPED